MKLKLDKEIKEIATHKYTNKFTFSNLELLCDIMCADDTIGMTYFKHEGSLSLHISSGYECHIISYIGIPIKISIRKEVTTFVTNNFLQKMDALSLFDFLCCNEILISVEKDIVSQVGRDKINVGIRQISDFILSLKFTMQQLLLQRGAGLNF